MTDSIKLVGMQRTSIEYERQRHLANWFIKSSPHMATPPTPATLTTNSAAGGGVVASHLHVEGRKPKLRRFNSHDTSANMFSVADFENARLARRNEIEMKQRLQRRLRMHANGLLDGACDFSTEDSKSSKYSNESQQEPLPADIFLSHYSLPRVVRVTYKTKRCDETLQSSSSNDSSTVNSHSVSNHSGGSGSGSGGVVATHGTETETSCSTGSSTVQNRTTSNNNNAKHVNSNFATTSPGGNTATANKGEESSSSSIENGELFLLYRLIRQRHIYHAYNAKTAATNRKKCVLIPQEFPGYFSLLNEKGLPTATVYTSLIQLVRERVYKFVSVDNMPAFSESQPNAAAANNTVSTTEGCLSLYTTSSSSAGNNRPQYVKTTARGGQVFRLLAVFEDGKQDHHALASGNHAVAAATAAHNINTKQTATHGREKEKGRYAQLLNEQRQILYVSLSTKGKFYEIEPGIPQILQKLGGMSSELNKKINPDCVHRITMLVGIHKQLPLNLRYISGPTGCGNVIPEYVSITKISTENVLIACPIEDLEATQAPLHLRKLHLTKEMNLLRSSLGFESESRMLANPNVQNMLKYCQFNCDQFLKMLEVEQHSRNERSGSKSRVEGLRILKPLHLPKLLRREKTMSVAHERENSIIFFSKNDLDNMQAKEQSEVAAGNRISDKMKVFQSTKKKWFRKQNKSAGFNMTALELNVQHNRRSMERYSDISKLLQERFGDKPNTEQCGGSVSGASVMSELGCSDTETALPRALNETMKNFRPCGKERLLQKSMSLQDIELRKPDLLAAHARADTISEVEAEEQENCLPLPQSFITEKLYNEFHVKTRQYSKSSSSLHQLLNFSLPQKLHINDNSKREKPKAKKQTEFDIGAPVTNGNLNESADKPISVPLQLLEDDLPYSSVRDSLVLSSDESPSQPAYFGEALAAIDPNKENIYAEICHEGVTHSQTRETFTDDNTRSTQLLDDYGDYASLSYEPGTTAQAVSRVQVNCMPNNVSYHTVYLGEEALGPDRAHVTTVELKGGEGGGNNNTNGNNVTDNIYNTLK